MKSMEHEWDRESNSKIRIIIGVSTHTYTWLYTGQNSDMRTFCLEEEKTNAYNSLLIGKTCR